MSTALKPTLKEKIVASLDQLPPQKLAEVYDFVEHLRQRKRAPKSTKPRRPRRKPRETLGQHLIEAFEDLIAGRGQKITCAEDLLRGD
jgi:hypothetical protein